MTENQTPDHRTCPGCHGTVQRTRRITLEQSFAVHETVCPDAGRRTPKPKQNGSIGKMADAIKQTQAAIS